MVRIVRRVVRPVVGRVVRIIMPVVRVIQSLFERLQLGLKPGLGIKGSVLDLVADAVSLGKGCVESILDCSATSFQASFDVSVTSS